MKKNIRYGLLFALILGIVAMSTGCDLFIKTNNDKVDLNWYMALTYEDANGKDVLNTTKTGTDIAAVALEDKYSTNYGIIKDGDGYVNIDTLKEGIDKRFYWDKSGGTVMFTNADTIYTAKAGESTIEGKGTEDVDYVTSIVENNKCYVNIKFIKKFVDLDYKISKKSGKTPYRITLTYSNDKKTILSSSEDIEMRTKGNYQNMVVTTVDDGTKVTLVAGGKTWNKVRTDDGFIGYIPVKKLDNEGTKTPQYKSDKDKYTHVTMKDKVSLVWNQIYNQTANKNLDNQIAKMSGVNVISPTWFSIDDTNGNLSTLADLEYVQKAHKKGLKVWALVNDFKDAKITKAVLTSTKTRQKLVKNIMFYIESYELDGVNIDFEYIRKTEGDSYLQFLRELSVSCRKAKKVLSIDNYVPTEWSRYYDREQQLLLADYIITMNYDEHIAGSKEAGSVASISYADKGIKDTIAEAKDASRIINGIPFYTRLWCETPEEDSDGTGTLIQDAANGNYYLSSKALGMDDAVTAYKDAGVKPTFDKVTGQNFVTYSKGKKTYSIWLEDAASIKSRLELMNKYKLGGSAFWALGQETDSIWKTVAPYFK